MWNRQNHLFLLCMYKDSLVLVTTPLRRDGGQTSAWLVLLLSAEVRAGVWKEALRCKMRSDYAGGEMDRVEASSSIHVRVPVDS